MAGAHDRSGNRLKAGNKVMFNWTPDQVKRYAPGWWSEDTPGLSGRAIITRVLSPEEVRLDFRQNMGLAGPEGDEVVCHPDTLTKICVKVRFG